MAWTWGWNLRSRVQVWSTRVKPSSAPRRLGSRPKVSSVLGGGGKEQIEEQATVAADERAQQCRQGEDDVEVVGGEQAFASSIDPTELGRALAGGAVAVEAGVVEGHLGRALLAAVEMAAEGGGAAAFEIAENALLLTARGDGFVESSRRGCGRWRRSPGAAHRVVRAHARREMPTRWRKARRNRWRRGSQVRSHRAESGSRRSGGC